MVSKDEVAERETEKNAKREDENVTRELTTEVKQRRLDQREEREGRGAEKKRPQ